MGFKNNKKQDDFLFLKLFSDAYFSKGTASNEGMLISTNENSKIQNEKVYKFRIDYKNLQFKSINLSETIEIYRRRKYFREIIKYHAGRYK